MDISPSLADAKSNGKVCRLRKSLYGLKHPSRAWFERFAQAMLKYGFMQSQANHTLFVRHSPHGMTTALIVYVDDIVQTGDNVEEIPRLKEYLAKEFEIKDLGYLKYFLGIEVARSKYVIFICQRKYVLDLLKETGMLGGRPCDTPLELGQKLSEDQEGDLVDRERYQRLVDKLIYLSQSHPDIAIVVSMKIVRYGEENSNGANAWNHTHHHHHHKNSKKLKDDNDDDDKIQQQSLNEKNECISEMSSQGKRKTGSGAGEDNISDAPNGSIDHTKSMVEKEPSHSPSNLVFGYLYLFSDGHNFTDGMVVGSAFLLYGSVGGWSRTLFLLHMSFLKRSWFNDLGRSQGVIVFDGKGRGGSVGLQGRKGRQLCAAGKIGDFGILVRSGFSVSKALFFNFLSALVALAGTSLALVMGQDPGQSSLIEGFTAGGFVYIAVA
ncbi:hypothetical protein HYC85_024011 [Camellia sinensis]|uniref:Reverse transcriptase Ty1/copia-type domain-containing protein n=1 Tax=Camellia sinensis TaxID=4442 RepID=A0A7J7GG57_CAMSI|nr:hypothetical protein HYC85_024011 [Camellia sinensis]